MRLSLRMLLWQLGRNGGRAVNELFSRILFLFSARDQAVAPMGEAPTGVWSITWVVQETASLFPIQRLMVLADGHHENSTPTTSYCPSAVEAAYADVPASAEGAAFR